MGLTGLATAVIALFAIVQVVMEWNRIRDRRRSLKIQLLGPAWLARRSLEEDLREAQSTDSPTHWRSRDILGCRLDRIEKQVLQMLELSAQAGGQTAKHGANTFAAWLAYADRRNRILGLLSEGEQKRLFSQTIQRLVKVIDELQTFAPRRQDEPRLPELDEIRPAFLLSGSADQEQDL